MRILLLLFRYSRRAVVLAAGSGVVSGLAGIALLAVLNSAINGHRFPRGTLLWAFVALCVAAPLTRYVSEVLLLRLGHSTIQRLRLHLCHQLLAAPQRHLEQLGAPRLMSILTGDIPTITTTMTALPVLTISVALVAGCLIYLGLLSWQVLLGVLLVMLLGIVSYQLPIARGSRIFQLARLKRDELYGHYRALIEGSKELKLHYRRRLAFATQQLAPAAEEQRRLQVSSNTLYIAAASWGQLLAFAAIGVLVFYVPTIVSARPRLEVVNGFALVLLYLVAPLQVLLNSLPLVQQAEVALRRVEELGLDLTSRAEPQGPPPVAAPGWRKIELRRVSRSYGGDAEERGFTLGPVDLCLQPGELLFLAGGNGSGKTTLAKVLVGLYPPESGQVLLDGQPVDDGNRETYRQHFSAVFSDFFLFEQLLGMAPDGLDEQARRYLAELRLERKVTVSEGRLSTTELSQGQRKRLALLTAFLEDRPVYVFDEWAADQDPQFREVFYFEILPELKRRGKAVVVISHDDRYYGGADRVVKLDAGRVVEESSCVAELSA
jgi:putative ATP-binding cassette transporter